MLKNNRKLKIGIFTSSTPIGFYFPQRFERAKKFLESKGHEVVLGSLFNKKEGYRSGNIKERVNEINELLEQNVDVLMASIGGYISTSIIPYLNYELMDRKEIILCGFSDITVILNAVLRKTKKVRAFYGPNLVKNFGNFEEELNEFTYNSFIEQVFKQQEIEVKMPKTWNQEMINWEKFEKPRTMIENSWKTINDENVSIIEGVVKGGNSETLILSTGTEYGPVFDENTILLIEDTSLDASLVERVFATLKIKDFFKNVKAIILGKLENYNDQNTGIKVIDILLEIIGNKIPIIYDVDCSHTYPMTIIELNKKIKIDFKNKKIYQ